MPSRERRNLPGQVEFRREALPSLAALEREWGALEAAGRPSFFTSWRWVGTLLAAMPAADRPELLRGCEGGETIALALLGANVSRRRHGLVRSRGLYLNETGNARFDALSIEHNSILTAAGRQPLGVLDAVMAWFASLRDEADELHFSGSLWRLPEKSVEARKLGRTETVVPSYSIDL